MNTEANEEVTTGTDIGTTSPTPDQADESLLDSLGFGGEAPQPLPVPGKTGSEEPVSGESAPSQSNEGDSLMPDDVFISDPEPPKQPEQPEPKLEKVVPEEPPAPKFSDPKANHAFAELRHSNSELTKQVQELQQQLLERQEALPQVEQIRSEYEEKIANLQNQIGQYDLAATDGFRNKYDAVLSNMLGKAVNMLKKAGVSEADAAKAVQQIRGMETIQRAEELNNISPTLAGPIVTLFEDFDELLLKRETELKNWKDSRNSVAEEEKRIKKAKSFEVADSLASTVVSELQTEKHPFYSRSTKDPNWNDRVEKRISTLRGLLKGGDPSVLSKLVAEGLAAQEYRKLYLHERKKRTELQDSVGRRTGLTGAAGNAPSGYAPSPSSSTRPADDEQLLTNLGF